MRLPWFLKSLPLPLDIHGLKISFYRIILVESASQISTSLKFNLFKFANISKVLGLRQL